MGVAVDRMWNVRDAVLAWLYEEAANGHRSPHPDAEAIQTTVNWAADPIDIREVHDATNYLKAEGLITGTGAMGGGVVRPFITSLGENTAAKGMTLRPGPEREANLTGVTNNYTFNNHGPSNNAVNSSDFTQTITVDQKTEKILEVADALEAHAETGPANADEARRIAADLREAAAEPEENKSKLQSFLATAIGALALSAGTTAGQQATQLAVEALQSLA